LVSYADEAYVDDRPVEVSATRFFLVNEHAVMRTGNGRAEVLLGPCSAMWIDENSSFRMVSSALSDASIELLTGSVVVAAGVMVKGTRLTVLLKTSVASVDPKGAYRLDAEPPRVKVLAGKTAVQWADRAISVTAGRLLVLDALADIGKFDKRSPDPLENWSNRRAAYLARLSDPGRSGLEPSRPDDAPKGHSPRGNLPVPPLQPLPIPANLGCGVTAW
jgi:hypothetical protein